jgi:hypothetical protein
VRLNKVFTNSAICQETLPPGPLQPSTNDVAWHISSPAGNFHDEWDVRVRSTLSRPFPSAERVNVQSAFKDMVKYRPATTTVTKSTLLISYVILWHSLGH